MGYTATATAYQAKQEKQNINLMPLDELKRVVDVLNDAPDIDTLTDTYSNHIDEYGDNDIEIDISFPLCLAEHSTCIRIATQQSKYGYEQVFIRIRILYSGYKHAIVDIYQKVSGTIDDTKQIAYEKLIATLTDIIEQREANE